MFFVIFAYRKKKKKKNAIALKMRQAGLPIEQIMQFTGLSEENIKSL